MNRPLKFLLLFSCFIEVYLPLQAQSNDEVFAPMILGDQLENPYSVENMQLAYDQLKLEALRANTTVPEITIQATHKYVRFLPADEDEQRLLFQEEDLELFDHPFDYEILSEGDYYHDPDLPDGSLTWYYTTVPIGYRVSDHISSIAYEELSELYLPEDFEDEGRVDTDLIAFLEDLEDKSLELTGNLEEAGSQNRVAASRYNPQGQIMVSNPTNGALNVNGDLWHFGDGARYEGVPKVKARVRRWFKIRTAWTDNQGKFVITARFRRSVNYGIIYKNEYAQILPGVLDINYKLYGGAFLNGPRGRGAWRYVSEQGSSTYKWGIHMRAVYDYHTRYSPMMRIGAPPHSLTIAAFTINTRAFAPMFVKMLQAGESIAGLEPPASGWLLADVYMDGKNLAYTRVYNTAIHELSHAAHWKHGRNWLRMLGNDCRMTTEAWADGVMNEASMIKFNDNVFPNTACYDLSDRIDEKYPRVIVRDLMDNVGGCTNSDPIVDHVSGFTLNQLFYTLETPQIGSCLAAWRDNLIAVNPQQNEGLKEYFAQWMEESHEACNNPPLILKSDYTSSVTKEVTHSNNILMQKGFKFRAINGTYHFSARLHCTVGNSRQAEHSEAGEDTEDWIRKPNVSIIEPFLTSDEEPELSTGSIDLLVFPNPANGLVNLAWDVDGGAENVDIVIYDIRGRKVYSRSGLKNKELHASVDISDFGNGVFLVRLKSGDKSVIRRILVE